MFDIEYKGGNTVVVSTKKVNLAIDPRRSIFGLDDLIIKDAVQLASDRRLRVDDKAYRLIIDGPGEYEVADVSIKAIAAQRHIDSPASPLESTIYQLNIDGVKTVILGNIAPKLSEEQLEQIGVVDIVIIPVGGTGYTLDAVNAAVLARQFDPKVIIPVHYADAALKYEVPQDSLDVFIKEIGMPVENNSKLRVKSRATLPTTLSVVALARS